jgi:hypothetical protein
VRNARPGIQLFEYTMHELASDRCQRRVTDSTRFLLSRSTTVIRPVWSSQTRNRAKTRDPLRRSEMNRSDGALLPGVVVVVVVVVVFVTVVVVDVTVPDAFDTTVVAPPEACAVTRARSR